jgi:hypothetical protein
MLTMLLGGLWHGAAWTFVAWGGMHGMALIVHREWARLASPALRGSLRWLAVPLTFAWVLLAWVPFRAGDVYVAADSGRPMRRLADGFYREHAERPRFARDALVRDPRSGDWHEPGRPGAVRVRRASGGFGTAAAVWRALLVPGAGGPKRLAGPGLAALLALLAGVHLANRLRLLSSWWRAIPGWGYAGLLGAAAAVTLFLKPVAYRAFIYFQF